MAPDLPVAEEPKQVTQIDELAKKLAEHLKVCKTTQDKNDATPWWAKGTIGAIGQLGPTVVILFFVFGMFVGWLPSPFEKISAMDSRVAQSEKALTELIKTQEENTRVARIICRNVAKNPVAAAFCDQR